MARLSLIVDPTGAEQGYRRARQAGERYKATARDTTRATDRIRGSFDRLTSAAFSLRGALAGIGVGLIIRRTIRAFSDFERQLVEVGKTTDLQGRNLERLGERIQEIGQSVPLSTDRLLSLATAAGQLGVTGVENISRFAETLGQLEVATDIAGEQGARSLARLLNITGQGVENIDRLGASITALGNNFATTEEEIARTATFLAASTQQFDLTAQQVLGLSAALRSLGQRAETSGSAVGAALSEINMALASGGEGLQTLTNLTGQTAEQLRQTFAEDATEVLTDFAEALGDLPAAEQTRVLEDFNLAGRETRRVIGALAADTDMVRRALQTANEEWTRNEALNIEAARAAETFSAQMTFLGNAINEAAVDIGRELAPVILEVTRDIRDFVQEASQTGQLERTFRDVADALQVLVDNMDALVVAGGALIGLRLGAAFGPWGALLGAAAGAMVALSTAADSTEEALSNLEDASRSLSSVIDRQTESSNRAAQAAREQALAALDAAEAQIQSIRRIQAARESVGAGTGAVNPEGSTIFSRQIDALQAERERIQGQLDRLDAQEVLNRGLTAFDRFPGETTGGGTPDTPGGGGSGGGDRPDFSAPERFGIPDQSALQRLEQAVRLQRLDRRERAQAQAVIEAQNEAMAEGNLLSQQDVELIRQRAGTLFDLRNATEEAVDESIRLQQETERLDDMSRRLGFTFSSAFEDAVVAGDDLRSVLQGVLQDITRILIRTQVTEPASGLLGDIFSGFLGGFGGGVGSLGSASTFGEGSIAAITPAFGAADGGEFRVGSGFPSINAGRDNRLVSFAARDGETVSVTTPEQQRSRRPGPTVFIDARGADSEGMANLANIVQQMGGELRQTQNAVRNVDRSIEGRAVAAVQNNRGRTV